MIMKQRYTYKKKNGVSYCHEAPGVLQSEATMVTQKGWLLQRWCFSVASGT